MYTALSQVYDLFGENDEKSRADWYCKFLPHGGDGADLGCGTGTLTLELYRRGYKVYGIDSSAGMLGAAKERAAKAGADIKFVLGDARKMPFAHELDFVIAACDVFNYISKPAAAFAQVHAALKKGGVFAFDISSEYKLKNVLAGNTFSETKDDVTYVWRNFMRGNRLNIDFTVFSPQGASYIKTCETQVQYAHAESEILDLLAAAGFGEIKSYEFGKTCKPKEKTQRIAFAAKK